MTIYAYQIGVTLVPDRTKIMIIQLNSRLVTELWHINVDIVPSSQGTMSVVNEKSMKLALSTKFVYAMLTYYCVRCWFVDWLISDFL